MKQNYFKLFLGFLLFASASVQAQVTYSYTGATGTYIVPGGVGSISIEAKGSKGLDDAVAGGNGATMYGEFDVSPGDVLTYYVGGNSAGLNAGGDGTYVENTTTGTLLIVAGGGGGAAYSQIGTGAPTTNDGNISISHAGYPDGAAGTGGNGGGAGDGAWGTGGGGGWLSAGSAGAGSPGGPMSCRASYGTTYAGGAGGGYSGGGGVDMDSGWSTGGGGAGGSYNIGEAQANVAENNAALGEITINELCSGIEVTVTAESICLGDSFTLEGTGDGEITWDGGLIDGEAFTPADAGVFTFNSSSDSDADCDYTIDIEVLELPTVTASVDFEEICFGETITLNGGGADTYVWFPLEIEDGEAYTPEVGEYIYSVVGTDDAGCENIAEVEVTVYALPEVTATATDEEICLGESVTLNGEGATDYVWDAEEDGVEFTPDATGTTTYTVEGTDDNGCSNDASIDITVYDALEITFTTTDEILGSDGTIDITVTGGSTPYTYDWDNDGTGDFDDVEDLDGLICGDYTVVVMCDAGCTATETITVDCQVGIETENRISLSVYPNPTLGAITVQFPGQFNYELTAINGDRMLNGQGVDQTEISLENFANGIYFVTVRAEGQVNTIKVVKK
ncbi:MAG: T9SS type A sorting domain-containing protein [Crocinitomix sp.]|nr:T9SS type A sorting domain-containing protein [Crocinitomix sp.]